jgi:hypothetical protein
MYDIYLDQDFDSFHALLEEGNITLQSASAPWLGREASLGIMGPEYRSASSIGTY